MAEELIASRYADDVYASFTYTDDEIDAYYAENADSYDRVNVLYTLISAAANEDEGIDADTAKAAAEALQTDLDAAKADIDALTKSGEEAASQNTALQSELDAAKAAALLAAAGDYSGYVGMGLTQEQADKLYAVITSTSALYDFSSDSIFGIVKEQSQAYFSGQKTAEDVAKLVQSKANIYVNEQR